MAEFIVVDGTLTMCLDWREKLLARCLRSPKVPLSEVERVFFTDRVWTDVLLRKRRSRWSRPIDVSWATNNGLEIPTYLWLLLSVRTQSERGVAALMLRGDTPAVCIDLARVRTKWGFFAVTCADAKIVARELQVAIHG